MTQNKEDNNADDIIGSAVESTKTNLTDSTEDNKNPLIFISKISHEIRSILHVVMGLSDCILSSYVDEDQHEKRIKQICQAIKNLHESVNILLLSNDKNSSEINVRPKLHNIVFVIEEIVDQYRLSLPKHKNLKIEFCSHAKEIFANIDRFWIQQVMLNLLDNAVKYGNDSDINIKLSTFLQNKFEYVEILVIDSGIGITSSEINDIFNLYKRINHDNNTNEYGAGIGLHICQEVVEAHEGFIDAKNNPDCGITVRIVLPIKLMYE